MAGRIKIGVVVGGLEVGGAELDIARNYPRLDRERFDVVVINFGTPGALAPQLVGSGIPVIARLSEDGMPVEATAGWLDRLLARIAGTVPDSVKGATRSSRAASRSALAAATRGFRRGVRRVLSAIASLPPIVWLRRKIGTFLYMWLVARWVGHRLNDENVDICHCFLPHSYAYGMLAVMTMRPKTRRVMSRLSLNFYKGDLPWLAWLERHVFHPRVDIAIGNSQRIIEELVDEGVDPAKTRLLYNGIDVEPFIRVADEVELARSEFGIGPDQLVFVAVGNLHTYKGHADLIEAAALVRDELPAAWKVLIAGRDQTGNRAKYEQRVRDLGLEDHIRLLGSCDDVPHLLRAADVFVHPSHHEGLPNAIIEAMASDLPVIGTMVGGIPELVTPVGEPDETGWLVPAEDARALSAALLDAAADTERRHRMGRTAHGRVTAQFSLDHSVAAYESIYRELA